MVAVVSMLALLAVLFRSVDPTSLDGASLPTQRVDRLAEAWRSPLQHLATLYERYGSELAAVHAELEQLPMLTLSSYMELEITYMRIREAQPQLVFELGPHHGSSTVFLLHALRRNGHGMLHSFDLVEAAGKRVPQYLRQHGEGQDGERCWVFVQGDIMETWKAYKHHLYDYIFIDGGHDPGLTNFYLSILEDQAMLRAAGGASAEAVPVTVHDIYHELMWDHRDIGFRDFQVHPLPLATLEGQMVVEWLAFGQSTRNVFGLNAARWPALTAKVAALRQEVAGLGCQPYRPVMDVERSWLNDIAKQCQAYSVWFHLLPTSRQNGCHGCMPPPVDTAQLIDTAPFQQTYEVPRYQPFDNPHVERRFRKPAE